MSDMLRITGMVTGLDTDDMVRQLLKVEQIKIDRVKQKKQYSEWQRDTYREISNLMRAFKDEYFSYLNADKNMRTPSSLNSFKVLYGTAETSPYLNINATKDSSMLQNPITKIQMATTAKVSGISLAKPIEGQAMTGFDISLANDNTKATFTFNGITKVIDITPMNDATGSVTDVAAGLQAKLNAAFGDNKIIVSEVPGEDRLSFTTANTNTLKIDYAYNAGLETLFTQSITKPLNLTEQNNKFKLTLTNAGVSTTKTMELATGEGLTLDQIVSDLQTKIDAASGFGNGTPGSGQIRVLNQNNRIVLKPIATTATASGSLTTAPIGESTTVTAGVNDSITVRIGEKEETFSLGAGVYSKTNLVTALQKKLDGVFGVDKAVVSLDDTGNLRFEEVDSTKQLSLARQEDGGLAALKLDGPLVNRSNKMDMSTSLAEIKKTFQTELSPNDSVGEVPENDDDIEFTINGERFSFRSTETTLSEVINTVNSNANANVIMSYNEMTDSITVESKNTGELSKIEIADVAGEGNLMAVLGLHGLSDAGTDAKVTFAGGTPQEYTITRSTNTFNFDNVTYELKKDYVGSLDVSVTVDTTKAYDLIKGFVDKYNEVISKVQTRVSEKRYRDFVPLTDAQKKDMSEKEVELWETQAKKGILRGDTLLYGIRDELRGVLSENVDGVRLTLFDMGISTTNDYTNGGKLEINEERLKAALRDKPQEVMQLFTQTGETTESKGLSHRLFDVVEKYVRTNRDANGQKGLLLEKAGIEGDITEVKNQIAEQIEDYDTAIDKLLDKLSAKEEHYYLMFARMERAISQMNTQSSWLASQFGGGNQ